MNLELYRTFFYIAKTGSISRASEELYITQPAVSRALRQLEEGLGCTLFYRTSRGVRLTPEGELLFKYIEQAFGFIESGEKRMSEVKNLMAGEIRVGVSDTLCKHYLLPYLKLFNTFYPSITISVVCPTTPAIIGLLKSGKIDFGIINMPYSDDQLVFKSLMEICDCFIAGEKYRTLCNKRRHLSELTGYPFLLLERNSNSRTFIDQYFSKNGADITPALELGNMDLLVQFARNDFGIACVIKNFIQEELEKGSLYEVKPVEKIPKRSIGAVWLKEVHLPAAARELIKQLVYIEPSDV